VTHTNDGRDQMVTKSRGIVNCVHMNVYLLVSVLEGYATNRPILLTQIRKKIMLKVKKF